ATMSGCAPQRYRPSNIDYELIKPVSTNASDLSGQRTTAPTKQGERFAKASEPASTPTGVIHLDAVIDSVISRYPPYLSALLERDIASGRLQQAMGSFDTQISAKVGGRVEGFYEST